MPENDYISCIVELSAMAGIFWRSFVKRFALSCGTVVCLSLLSVALVYCGQTVGWIRMPLCVEVGLSLGHIELDGDPAPPPPKKTQQPPPTTFRLMSVVAKRLGGSRCRLVTDFGTNRKLICSFLLVIILTYLHSYLAPFRDVAFDSSKIAIFDTPLVFISPDGEVPLGRSP